MNIILWILQILLAVVFMFSGLSKSIYSQKELITKGQTGVTGLPLAFIRFIGVSEILGAIGIIIPWWINILPVLTPIAAICLAFVMIPAGVIHYRRIPLDKQERNNVITNIVIFGMAVFVAYERLSMVW